MAMTLRLSDEQTEALRRKAEAEHRSMQQVAQAAIDAYVHQPVPVRRQLVPVTFRFRKVENLVGHAEG